MVRVALVVWVVSGDVSLMLPFISAPPGALCWGSKSWPAKERDEKGF